MIPKEEWLRILEAYSAQIWPAQIGFYIAAILLDGWFILKPLQAQTRWIKLYLSIAFAWNGVVWFLILAKDMAGGGYGNYFFAVIFMVVSMGFAIDIFKQKMQFSFPKAGWRKSVTTALMLLVFCYPLFGIAFGHKFPRLIFPGTYPCPTIALGLLLLTTALPRVDKLIYILLLICAIPFTPFVQIARYGVYEDTVLLTCGIYSLILLLKAWRAGDPGG